MRDGSEATIDRRLIANLLVPFISSPRGDTKRYEMLSVISSVLNFNEDEKYKVGIGRRPSGGAAPMSPSIVSPANIPDDNANVVC
jgi:hypothetical protein